MNDKDNQRLINDMCKRLHDKHEFETESDGKNKDKYTSLFPVGMPDRSIEIEKTGKDTIRLSDFGYTLFLAEATYEFHIEHTEVAKKFKDILKLYQVKFDEEQRTLYIDTTFKDALVSISRMRQATTRIYDLMYFRLIPDMRAKENI